MTPVRRTFLTARIIRRGVTGKDRNHARVVMSTRKVQLDRKGTGELLNTERQDRIPQSRVGHRVTTPVVTTSAKIPFVDTDQGRTRHPVALTIRAAVTILAKDRLRVVVTIRAAVTSLDRVHLPVALTIRAAVTSLDRLHRPVVLTILVAVTILAKDRPPEVVTIQDAVPILAKDPVPVTTLVSAHRATDRRTVELLTHHHTNMSTVMSLPSLASQQSTYISVSLTQSVKTK